MEGLSSQIEISWTILIFTLLDGLTLFLYGIEKMSEGLKKSAGEQLRNFLAILTKNRFIALIVGALVTMVIQSSSATTVMLVGFVQAGIIIEGVDMREDAIDFLEEKIGNYLKRALPATQSCS